MVDICTVIDATVIFQHGIVGILYGILSILLMRYRVGLEVGVEGLVGGDRASHQCLSCLETDSYLVNSLTLISTNDYLQSKLGLSSPASFLPFLISSLTFLLFFPLGRSCYACQSTFVSIETKGRFWVEPIATIFISIYY